MSFCSFLALEPVPRGLEFNNHIVVGLFVTLPATLAGAACCNKTHLHSRSLACFLRILTLFACFLKAPPSFSI
jgi:hypothetical protein